MFDTDYKHKMYLHILLVELANQKGIAVQIRTYRDI